VNVKIMEEPSQEQNQALRELAHEVQHLAVVVHDTNDTFHDTHKLLRDEGLPVTRFIHNLIVKSSQRQVPQIILFTTGDGSFKQKLITKLVPGMKAVELHLLCEYKGQEHIVEGEAGCQVILQDENWKKVHELVKEGLKWVLLAVQVGAHITMGLGNMVPNPNLEYGKAVVGIGEGVLKDPPIDWATVTAGMLVRDEASAIRTAESMSAETYTHGRQT
jgi:hypothetical protein